ncbi:hypothetical protein PROFUN_15026 [Planoprotostelium fungivorum]|uniref:Uncharacterized protein n=1 Tax=Planoprotostelium fungivorum TaxID=1890364 RepID=A0A2P6MXW7_9EUKA|nr:hypothetical protein PROFUN_15026 [Planoprotostelium fungivorum]
MSCHQLKSGSHIPYCYKPEPSLMQGSQDHLQRMWNDLHSRERFRGGDMVSSQRCANIACPVTVTQDNCNQDYYYLGV